MGPLQDHGDRIVASGVDPRGQMARFVVDPEEGEILRSWPVTPAFGHGGPDEGFAVPGPYEPVEEGDLGAGSRDGHVHARRNEGEAPDRYARGPQTARNASPHPAVRAFGGKSSASRGPTSGGLASDEGAARYGSRLPAARSPSAGAAGTGAGRHRAAGQDINLARSYPTDQCASFFRAQFRAGERAESLEPYVAG